MAHQKVWKIKKKKFKLQQLACTIHKRQIHKKGIALDDLLLLLGIGNAGGDMVVYLLKMTKLNSKASSPTCGINPLIQGFQPVNLFRKNIIGYDYPSDHLMRIEFLQINA